MIDPPESSFGDRLRPVIWGLARDNWKVALYVLLIVLCVLFAPEEPLKFIYTEF